MSLLSRIVLHRKTSENPAMGYDEEITEAKEAQVMEHWPNTSHALVQIPLKDISFTTFIKLNKKKLTGNFWAILNKMAKKTLNRQGLEPETSGLKSWYIESGNSRSSPDPGKVIFAILDNFHTIIEIPH